MWRELGASVTGRRPRRRHRRVRRRAGADPGRDGQARRRRGPAAAPGAAPSTCRTAATSSRSWIARSVTATSSSRWAAATSGCSPTPRSSGSGWRCRVTPIVRAAERSSARPCGDATPCRRPARAADLAPDRRPGGALPRARARRRSARGRPSRRGDRDRLDGARQGIERPRVGRRVPTASSLRLGRGYRWAARDGERLTAGRRDAASGARRRRARGTAWAGWSSASRSPRASGERSR